MTTTPASSWVATKELKTINHSTSGYLWTMVALIGSPATQHRCGKMAKKVYNGITAKWCDGIVGSGLMLPMVAIFNGFDEKIMPKDISSSLRWKECVLGVTWISGPIKWAILCCAAMGLPWRLFMEAELVSWHQADNIGSNGTATTVMSQCRMDLEATRWRIRSQHIVLTPSADSAFDSFLAHYLPRGGRKGFHRNRDKGKMDGKRALKFATDFATATYVLLKYLHWTHDWQQE